MFECFERSSAFLFGQILLTCESGFNSRRITKNGRVLYVADILDCSKVTGTGNYLGI